MSEYHFCVALENSAHADYVTEKALQALAAGIIDHTHSYGGCGAFAGSRVLLLLTPVWWLPMQAASRSTSELEMFETFCQRAIPPFRPFPSPVSYTHLTLPTICSV
eukprot:635966-Rhodomonas_salina.2